MNHISDILGNSGVVALLIALMSLAVKHGKREQHDEDQDDDIGALWDNQRVLIRYVMKSLTESDRDNLQREFKATREKKR